MAKRPKIKLALTNSDKILEIIGWIFIFTIWMLTLTIYDSLPEIIPTHYNIAGVADRFGEKWMVLTLPLWATLLFVGLTILNKFPHVFNYPTEITADNAERQYTNATKMIRYLKVTIVVVFTLIVYRKIRYISGQIDAFSVWFLPLIIILIFAPVVHFATKSFREKR